MTKEERLLLWTSDRAVPLSPAMQDAVREAMRHRVQKYDPDQPRVPAGSSEGGRFASGGEGGGSSKPESAASASSMQPSTASASATGKAPLTERDTLPYWEHKVVEAIAADNLWNAKKEWKTMSIYARDRLAQPESTIPAAIQAYLGDKTRPNSGDGYSDLMERVDQYKSQMSEADNRLAKEMVGALHDELRAMEVPPDKARAIAMDATDALIAQEMEAQTRTLGDHGIHHLEGDYRMAMDVLEALPGNHATLENRLAVRLAAIYHDSGYLAPPAHMFLDDDHPRWAAVSAEQNVLPAIREALGPTMAHQIGSLITRHAETSIDWENDPMVSAFSLADNMALFHREKIPPVMRAIPELVPVLVAFGREEIKRDEALRRFTEGIEARKDIGEETRRRFKHAAGEITSFLPKATLGMLGAKVARFEWNGPKDKGHIVAHVERHEANEDLCRATDLGQAQFKKMAETYGADPMALLDNNEVSLVKDGRVLLRMVVHDRRRGGRHARKS